MVWTVSRQQQWATGDNVVEISEGGIDYANADMLVEHYPGEGKEYLDPREAVEAAVEIALNWQQDDPGDTILIGYGYTGGMSMPFEGEETTIETFAALREWAQELFDKAKKCDQCSEVLPDPPRWYIYELDESYCSEYCAERGWNEYEGEDHKDLER